MTAPVTARGYLARGGEPARQSADLADPGARAAHGPRAVEEGLLAELEAACEQAVRDPRCSRARCAWWCRRARCASRLSCALVARGRARVGVRVQTLESLAHEVLERAGESAPPSLLLGEAVRELARREPALARDLDRLDDGYAAAFASVEDLLDAGYTELHLESAARARGRGGGRTGARARRRAAARRGAGLARARRADARASLSRARARERPAARRRGDPARARALDPRLRRRDGRPARPARDARAALRRAGSGSIGAGHHAGAFGARLRERLAPAPVLGRGAGTPNRASRASRHADPEREARAAAAWARDALEAGIAPEQIAIVARDLARHRLALRRQLGRFGVPFSGAAERGAITPAGRQLAALCELLDRGGALPAERWLDASAPRGRRRGARRPARRAARARHRLARRSRGGRARVVARRRGAARARRGSPSTRTGSRARRGGGSAANGSTRCARRRSRRCAGSRPTPRARRSPRAPRASPSSSSALGWSAETPGHADLGAVVGRVRSGGRARAVGARTATRVLRRALGDAGTDPLGGRGGGVQVLSVMEARARTFAAVRVIGLQRGVFPRRVTEDPLLPDALRRALRDVLPDLPVKAEGHEEERFLFAQLCAAAPQVHLSCAQRDATGRATPPSPLFERAAVDRVEDPERETRSPRDALLAVARDGSRADFAAALPAALAEARRALGLGEPAPRARGRAARRAARARPARRAPAPAGSVPGRGRGAARPRRSAPRRARGHAPRSLRALSVAGVPVAHARHRAGPRCAGRAARARSDRRLVGNVVHGALALACADRRAGPTRCRRELAARSRARADGEAGHRAARLRARARAQRGALRRGGAPARRGGGRAVRGVEVDGIARVRDAAGAARELRYRADRIDERGGALRLTDWKTGTREEPAGPPQRPRAAASCSRCTPTRRTARARVMSISIPSDRRRRARDRRAAIDARSRCVRRERGGAARCARCGRVHAAAAQARSRRGDLGLSLVRAAARVPARRQRRADAARRVGGGRGAARRVARSSAPRSRSGACPGSGT